MFVDILVLIILLISAVIAFLRGFIREVLTIAGVLGGLAAAYYGGPYAVPVFEGWFGVEKGVEPERLFGVVPYDIAAAVLAYASVFLIVVIVLSIISHILAESVKSLGLGAVDRSLGVVFGLVRGALLLGLLYLPVFMLVDKDTKEQWFEGSKTYFYLEKSAEFLHGFLPDSAVKKIEEGGEAASEASGAREKLKGIDLLGGQKEEEQEQTDGAAGQNGTGYSEQFRERMDELFQEGDKQPAGEYNE